MQLFVGRYIDWIPYIQYTEHKMDEKDCEKYKIEHIRVEGSNNTSGDMSAGCLAEWRGGVSE